MNRGYIPSIDGLRAVAILVVVASHVWRKGPIPGGMGVTLFFFISGFLITGLLIDEIQRAGTIDLKAFYVRRFRRLAPALLAMVAIVTVIYAVAFNSWSGRETLAAVFYLMNYYSIFDGDMPEPIGPLWSLAIEEHFYLLFPLVIAAFWRYGTRLFYVLIAVCVAVLIWRCALVASGASELRTYIATDTRIDSILFGCLLTIAMRLNFRLDWLASRWALVAGAALILLTLVVRNYAFRETLRYTIQGAAFTPLFCFLLTRQSTFRDLLETRPMIWIGKISYSLYLWHFPILMMSERLPVGKPIQLTVAIVISFAAAAISYYFVEAPLRAQHAPPRQLAAVSA